MRLRLQIEALLLGLVALFVVSFYLVEKNIFFESFIQLERTEAHDDLYRCIEALEREREHLRSTTMDWGGWDDTYRFVNDSNAEFAASNLTDSRFPAVDVDLIAIVNEHGKLVWGNFWDKASEKQVPLVPDDESWFRPVLELVEVDGKTNEAGIVLSSHGPILVGISQILTSDMQGPSRGAFIFGRFVDDSFRESLVHQTRVDFVMWSIQELPPDEAHLLEDAVPGTALILEDPNGPYLRAYHLYPGITGEPLMVVRAVVERSITDRGRWAFQISMASILGVSLFLLALVGYLLDRIVTHPIQRLTGAIAGIRESGQLSARIPVQTRNEIGVLASEFNDMLARLERDSAERALLTEELRRLSERDGLTNLWNRRHFDVVLAGEWERNGRHKLPLSVAVLDIDHFKQYNDTHGHQAGDDVLVRVAAAIRDAARRTGDVAARYGGEEFAIIMPGTPLDGAYQRALEICQAIRALGIPQGDAPEEGIVTASVGVASRVPDRASPPEILFQEADKALYVAKARGRDRVERHEG